MDNTHLERFDEAEASEWAKRAHVVPAPSMRAPIERSIAVVVVGERFKVSGGGDDSSAATHYVTMAGRDGKREELKTTESVAALVAPGTLA